jgi:MauM/NapG family ferredoxin protein
VEDPSRRGLLKAGGLAFVGGFFLYAGLGRIQRNKYLIRPPGSRPELDFMATCARCAQCMKVCPTNVIQPAVFAAGVEGFMTPQMDYRRAYCDWSCNECGKVCPTQAIRALPLEEKQRKIIGRAYIDHNTCIPWAEGRDCLVCQELCPTPDKAIVFDTGGNGRGQGDGQHANVKLPRVIPELCIGCGVCEHYCPVANEAAIRVRSTAQTGLLSR